MPSRADVEQLNALIAEAVALCEAAQERFEQIRQEFQKAIDEGRRLTGQEVSEEREARIALFDARVRLYERKRKRRQLSGSDE